MTCQCGHHKGDHRHVSRPMRAPQVGVCMVLDENRRFCGCKEYAPVADQPTTIERRHAQIVARMEQAGALAPKGECKTCDDLREYEDPSAVMHPRHYAWSDCESGGHPHCTCDRCW